MPDRRPSRRVRRGGLPRGKPGRTCLRLARGHRLTSEEGFVQQRLRHGERPLVLRRAQIAAQTPLREGSEFAGKAECVVERLTRCAQPVDETDMRCFRALDGGVR